jgi:long-chain acyl-CoA synthetase
MHPVSDAAMAKDILDLVDALVSSRPNAAAALAKHDEQWVPVSWIELRDRARRVARSLVAMGIAPGDRIHILSNSRLEWVVLDLGIVAAGAITVPIYPSNLPEECRFVADDVGARLVFCEDRSQVEKFLAVRDSLPELAHIVQITGAVEHDDVLGMDSFLALGVGVDEVQLVERRASLEPKSILTIVYTAGTTGRPKGVILTHANMLYEAKAIVELGLVQDDDVQLLILPLSHVFARVLQVSWLSNGHVLAFAESMTAIERNLVQVRPTLMGGVPRVFEKLHAAALDQGRALPPFQARLFARTIELSARRGALEQRGAQLGLLDSLRFAVLRRLVLTKVRAGLMQALGGRMRFMLSGGAPLASEIAWFFRDVGIEILEGYGLTETSGGTTINRPGNNRIGTVGLPFPGTEVRIAEDGEILLRGPGIMRGYWRLPEATAEALKDGWFHTGDIGELDPTTGALRITGRKKDLIITAGGKHIAPQKIEGMVESDRLISHCVVHGDRRKYLTAIVTLDPEALRELAQRRGLRGSHAELSQRPEVREAVERVIAGVNGQLASFETIKRFAILPGEFSVDNGELTAKLSVRRKAVDKRYAEIFEGLYAEQTR